jgi:hypothetical protein
MDESQRQQSSQQLESSRIQHAANKSKERLRLNSLKVLHFDSRDQQLIGAALQQIQLFNLGYN